MIWPRYHFYLSYGYGPWFTWRCFYPYYHRKYVFISLGGYWPFGYNYLRYYWYGCHPYWWYGYYPVAREIQTPVYNYYTYNYYTDAPAQPADQAALEQAEQDQGPDQMTLADVYFEEAVKAFEQANYQTAAAKFGQAMNLSPNDKILPFAYSQSLLATGQYREAAEVLRQALSKVKPDAEGVFYPRGLYANEDALLDQIDTLSEKAGTYSYDADLQLLLGYQLLGIGQTERAVEPLAHASQDLENAQAAGVLLNLAQKIDKSEAPKVEEDPGASPLPQPQSEATIETSPMRPEETALATDMNVEDGTSPEGQLDLVVAQDEEAGGQLPPDETADVGDFRIAVARTEPQQPTPALAEMSVGLGGYSLKWQGAMFLASLCTIAVSAGIRGYLRG